MATDNNVNELENRNENEVNEAPETTEKLSNHAKKKRYKDRYAQIKKKNKIERNIKAAQQQSSEQNSQNNVEQTEQVQSVNNEETQVNNEHVNDAQTEAADLRKSEPTGQGLRAFLNDEEDEPQIQNQPEPQKSEMSEQLRQQRPVVSSNLRSWLDEDDDVEKENAGSEQEVEDPMAELKANILKDMKKRQPKSEGLSQEDRERFIAQIDNVLALEQETMTQEERDARFSEINQGIISSHSEEKRLTKEETEKLDAQVEQAKKDELKEPADNAVDNNVDRNISEPLPDVELEDSPQTSQNSLFEQLLNMDNDDPEPPKPGIAEQLKQQRPVVSSNLRSWLDEDDGVENENAGVEQEVEDPMAELKATILNDMTKEQPKSDGLSREDRERLIAQDANVHALEQDNMTQEERNARFLEINQGIVSSHSEEMRLTKEETERLDAQVKLAKEDSPDENELVSGSNVKADLHDVFLPDVEFDDEEVKSETKDQPIGFMRGKALLNDDEADAAEDEHAITYEIKESVINSGNESINTHTLSMPSYNSYWIKRIEKDSFTQPVRSGLNNILKSAGVNENNVSALADEIHGPLSQTVAYDNSINRENINMHDMAARFFTDSYAAIDKAGLSPKNRIIAAQNIADLMIRNYSPMAFVRGDELGQYADKYVAQNKTLLKDQLEKLNVQDVDALVDSVGESLANGFEYDPIAPALDPTPVQNVNDEQHVADPEEELLKPRIPDFYQKLGERMDSADITNQVMSDIKYIIKDAGISDEKRVTEISDASYAFVRNQINSIYGDETVPETKMSNDAPTFFIKAYESLNGSDLSTRDQIIAAQKIASVMLKNYSPIAFIEEGLELYANDYVLNNRDVFRAQLDVLRIENAEALMDEVDAVRGMYSTIENEETEFEKWLNGRIDSPAVFGSVYNELSEFLQNAGFTDQDKLAELVRFTQHYGSRTVIDTPHLDGDNPNMHDIAVQFFEDSYRMIEAAGLSPKDRIITAQKVSDLLLKNYSPVGIEGEDFALYASNYVLGNTTLLKEQLEKLEVQDIDTLLADRDIISASGPENRIPDMINGSRLRENPRDYLLDRSRNDKAFTDIRNILVNAGIAEDVAGDLDVGDILEEAYSKKNIPADSVSMRDVAKNVFVSTYDALTKKEWAPENKTETVQKIADVILKNYSPIVRNRALNKYADSYVINDKELLAECLASLSVPEKEEKIEQKEPEKENEPVVKEDPKPEEAVPVDDNANISVFVRKLGEFNDMYKIKIEENRVASSVMDAWSAMSKDDNRQQGIGRKMLKDLTKDILKRAFEVEKNAAYNEHRLPEYTEIIKSSNEVLRSAMYAYTDLYRNAKSEALFKSTAFGCLDANEMAELTVGDSLWDMDQKSDEAWEIQSKEAKDITELWQKEGNPYEKMINEMKDLMDKQKDGTLNRNDAMLKFTAAEWLLINDERMMVYNEEDPINPIPNWGNRYWKAITEAREALGVDKHTSMRTMIQNEYAATAKAVRSKAYNERQINDQITDPEKRASLDSMDKQKEQFATLGASLKLSESQQAKQENEIVMTSDRVQISIKTQDQRLIMKNEPKSLHFVLDRDAKPNLTAENRGAKV